MAHSVEMPELGESVTEGTITTWLKEVGDEVEVDEPLLEVSTDKVDTEIPSPVAGTLLEIRAEEDDTVEVGAVLALVGSGSAGGGSAPSEGSSGQDEASAEEIEDKATEAEAPEETEEAAEAAGFTDVKIIKDLGERDRVVTNGPDPRTNPIPQD